MGLDLLLKPFEASEVSKRKEDNKPAFDYLKGGNVLKRIIEATNNNYNMALSEPRLMPDAKYGYWLVTCTLDIPGLGSRSAVGTAKALNEDAVKSAETDAIKRAAVKFGVGLQLYTEVDEWEDVRLATEAEVGVLNKRLEAAGKTERYIVGTIKYVECRDKVIALKAEAAKQKAG